MKKRAGLGEWEAIALLARLLARTPKSSAIETGIGDDAAVVRLGTHRIVWTIDVAVDDVHFKRDWLSYGDIGYRAFQAAVSDLAAMGARPIAALSSLILASDCRRACLTGIGRGQAEAARELDCPVIGGNISSGRELSVTTAVIGEARRPLLRSGARPGDEVWLIGEIGLARAGLELLRVGSARPRAAAHEALCIARWRRPHALVSHGLGLASRASAAIDVSDGLAGDAEHLARASKVRLVFEEDRLRAILRPELVSVAARLGQDPLDLALAGGEDYALLVTGLAAKRPRGARCVGSVTRGTGARLRRRNGRLVRLGASFVHAV